MMEFEKVYCTYFNDVFRYIRRLSGNEHIAEEITADVFFKAIHSIDSFRGDCDIRVWLCQIAKNSYLSYLKKSGHMDSIEDAELLNITVPDETIEEKIVRHDEAVRAQKVLHDIPDPYKEVFMWRVFAELSFKQIGQIFGKSENWACVTYHRARNKIKERLEGDHHEE
ncbi:MAG: sigma-70 family RNA polymerase sigma factor [Oscillospiraceae bacterium]|nr:sigma-70 family RNA polymerase sigma factor [Oscillospiraceae bacterium]